jgi:tetratricopeptide (TPR) repeat protein
MAGLKTWNISLLVCLAGLVLLSAVWPWLLRWDTERAAAATDRRFYIGQGRSLLAEYSFRQAMSYFHSGALPTMFDKLKPEDQQYLETVNLEKSQLPRDHWVIQSPQHGPPLDWLDRFSRNFFPTRHTHLNDGGSVEHGENQVREVLPWLWLTAEVNPHHVESYLEAAFWLRRTEGRHREAEAFLRQGYRSNPDSYELLFELGRVFEEEHADPIRARNVWEGGLARWEQRNREAKEPDELSLRQLTGRLARLEEREGNFVQAITYLARAKEWSKHTESLERWIAELRVKQGRTGAAARSE